MNQPPGGFDPDATQPIPVTPMPGPPPRPAAASFVPRFGNLGFYLVARLIAFAIDVFALSFGLAAFGFHAFEVGFLTLAGRDEGGFATLVAISVGIAVVFAFLCESLFGTTLGKAVFGLWVRRTNGRHAGVARVFVRYLLRVIDVVAIGPLLALMTPRHQRLGDFAGGTVVSFLRAGPLASIVALAALAAIAYAEFAFGGGASSALGVTAESASYGPDLIAKSAALVGVAMPAPRPPVPLASASPLPSSAPSPEPTATTAPSDEPTSTDAPSPAVTDGPSAAPAGESSGAPALDATAAPG